MRRTARLLGITRSLLVYYGIPFRSRRLRRFYSEFVCPGSLCFDIGAHAGNRVRCWRALGARVVAVEPQPDFARILRLLYGRDSGVTVVEAAVGAAPGAARLLMSERTPTVTTLSREWLEQVEGTPAFRGVSWREGAEVEMTTLQALIGRHGMPRFTKIDVEGYEADVLRGLSVALASLSFEYLPAARQVALECLEYTSSLGLYRYNWSLGESHRLAARDWVEADEMRRFIRELPETAGSGDVYARLDGA
jgi:FkbM family methyltransferase